MSGKRHHSVSSPSCRTHSDLSAAGRLARHAWGVGRTKASSTEKQDTPYGFVPRGILDRQARFHLKSNAYIWVTLECKLLVSISRWPSIVKFSYTRTPMAHTHDQVNQSQQPQVPSLHNLLLRFGRASSLNRTLLSGYGSNTTSFSGFSSLARWNISS